MAVLSSEEARPAGDQAARGDLYSYRDRSRDRIIDSLGAAEPYPPSLSLDSIRAGRMMGRPAPAITRQPDVHELLTMTEQDDTTQLLLDVRGGDERAFDRLFEHLYRELRVLAHERLRRFRPGETLSTTALVHEAYIRLVDQSRAGIEDRSHFLALASRAMRFVLVDYARARSAQKRGGRQSDLRLDALSAAADERADDILMLNDALGELAERDHRLSRVVEYRFFGGLTFEEIAQATGLSVPTLKRDWTRARAWLYRSIQSAPS